MDAAKAEWRSRLRSRLAAMSAAERQRQSGAICARVETVAEFRAVRTIVLYRSLGAEVDVSELWRWARDGARDVFFPRFDAATDALRFVRVTNAARWRKTPLGFWEPDSTEELNAAAVPRLVIIVPGLGFSPAGERIGRGRGLYDRALSVPAIAAAGIRVGVGFDEQIVDGLPVGLGDIPMHLVVGTSNLWWSDSHFGADRDITS